MPDRLLHQPGKGVSIPALLCVVALGAAPAARAQPGPEVWRFTHALTAPWGQPPPGRPRLAGQTLTLAHDSLRGPAPLSCTPARVTTLRLPAPGLFEGNLPAPAQEAATALGVTGFPVESTRVTCRNAGFDFHRVDAHTLLVGIDNRVWSLSATPGTRAPADSPSGMVQRLLETHFGGDMGFTPASVAAKKKWLSPALRRAVAAYLTRPASPDDVPAIDGDPFTDSQEYPTRFAVDNAVIQDASARVAVDFADAGRTIRLGYHLIRTPQGWLLDDIIDSRQGSLRALLTQPAR